MVGDVLTWGQANEGYVGGREWEIYINGEIVVQHHLGADFVRQTDGDQERED